MRRITRTIRENLGSVIALIEVNLDAGEGDLFTTADTLQGEARRRKRHEIMVAAEYAIELLIARENENA